jgi:hypothetical protein
MGARTDRIRGQRAEDLVEGPDSARDNVGLAALAGLHR